MRPQAREVGAGRAFGRPRAFDVVLRGVRRLCGRLRRRKSQGYDAA